MLIAMLVKYHVNKLPSVEDMLIYKALLPDIQTVQWLSFLLALSKAINSDLRQSSVVLSYQTPLTIQSQSKLFLAKNKLNNFLNLHRLQLLLNLCKKLKESIEDKEGLCKPSYIEQ